MEKADAQKERQVSGHAKKILTGGLATRDSGSLKKGGRKRSERRKKSEKGSKSSRRSRPLEEW